MHTAVARDAAAIAPIGAPAAAMTKEELVRDLASIRQEMLTVPPRTTSAPKWIKNILNINDSGHP